MSFRPEAIETALTIAMVLDSSSDYRDELWELKRNHKGIGALTHTSGCYRTAFIFDDFIVKVSKDMGRMQDLRKEAEAIEVLKSNPKTGRHFPDTFTFDVGNVIVQLQEKVDTNHRRRGIGNMMHLVVEQLGAVLGVDDVHTGNYGWKGPRGKEYPVFIDVDFRMQPAKRGKPMKVRSWMLVG